MAHRHVHVHLHDANQSGTGFRGSYPLGPVTTAGRHPSTHSQFRPGQNPASHKAPAGSTTHQVAAHGHLHAAGYSHTGTSAAGTHSYTVLHKHGTYGVSVNRRGGWKGFSPTGMQGGGHSVKTLTEHVKN